MAQKQDIRVLIVDDEERFRETTKTILERRGFEVTAVGDGPSAIEAVKTKPVDVIILDVRMPGMTGNEALREIKKIRPEAQVIMLTGHGNVESAMEGLQDGVFDYLRKPCNVELLASKIREAAGRAGALPQKESRVGDIMVPLRTFSTINHNATVEAAIKVILESFSKTMFTGTLSESVHRSVLVMNDRGTVIGVLSFIDMLMHVQPHYMRLLKDRPVMADNIHVEPPNFSGLFTILVRELGSKQVSELMSAAPPAIRPTDNLMVAVNRILTLNVRRLLVMEGDTPVGVVREQDLFFEIARILERHGKENGF